MLKAAGDMLNETHESAMRATRIAIGSFIIAVLAFSASAISVYFSYLDSEMDGIWQKEQIEALVDVVSSVETQNRNLVNIVHSSKEQLNVSQEALLIAQQQLNELKVISAKK